MCYETSFLRNPGYSTGLVLFVVISTPFSLLDMHLPKGVLPDFILLASMCSNHMFIFGNQVPDAHHYINPLLFLVISTSKSMTLLCPSSRSCLLVEMRTSKSTELKSCQDKEKSTSWPWCLLNALQGRLTAQMWGMGLQGLLAALADPYLLQRITSPKLYTSQGCSCLTMIEARL